MKHVQKLFGENTRGMMSKNRTALQCSSFNISGRSYAVCLLPRRLSFPQTTLDSCFIVAVILPQSYIGQSFCFDQQEPRKRGIPHGDMAHGTWHACVFLSRVCWVSNCPLYANHSLTPSLAASWYHQPPAEEEPSLHDLLPLFATASTADYTLVHQGLP